MVLVKILKKGRESVLEEGNERKGKICNSDSAGEDAEERKGKKVLKEGDERKRRRKKSERNSNSKGENPCRRVALR